MQRHIERKFRNSFIIGVIALLAVTFALVTGRGINAMAIYEEKGTILSAQTGTGLGFMIVVTIFSVMFALFALDFIIAGGNVDESAEKRLREFAAKCRGRGYSKEETISLLAKHGWDEAEIKDYLN